LGKDLLRAVDRITAELGVKGMFEIHVTTRELFEKWYRNFIDVIPPRCGNVATQDDETPCNLKNEVNRFYNWSVGNDMGLSALLSASLDKMCFSTRLGLSPPRLGYRLVELSEGGVCGV
jgi:hypothetical protein